MKISEAKLIDFIKKEHSWVDASSIAKVFDVSSRTVRNYIRQINQQYPDLITSSHKGYRIQQTIHPDLEQSIAKDDHKERQLYVVKRLVNASHRISIYDLADELYISDSQFHRVLKDVKDYLKEFRLHIERERNRISLVGEEIDKRKLINHLITDESTNGFLLSAQSENLLMDDHFAEIKNYVQEVIERNNLYANDYGFNTILVHVLIMVLRVKSKNFIERRSESLTRDIDEGSNEYKAAADINEIIHALYQFYLPPMDLYYLALIISNNCFNRESPLINISNIDTYVDKAHIELTQRILANLKENYCMDDFSSEFIVNFTIHVSNLFSRMTNRLYTKNPLAKDFKEQYPLIYDMATFVIKEIKDVQEFEINDDEIAFIGYHIGAYLEKNSTLKQKLNCCFLYADYHNIYLTALEKINAEVSSLLVISSVVSIKDVHQIPEETEMIISCAGKPVETDISYVDISILVSQNDIADIRRMAENIFLKKRKHLTRNILKLFIGEQLFKKDMYYDDEFEMIRSLGKECVEMKLCDDDYVESIIEREKLSSTSFKNGVAIPHSLQATANKSFLYIVLNTKPMKWKDNLVNVIVMIGISIHDRQDFKTIFDTIIQLLYEVDNVRKLTKCDDYNSLIDTLLSLMNETY